MNVGNQSTLNDLKEMQVVLDQVEQFQRDDVLSEKPLIGAGGDSHDFNQIMESGFYTVHRANGEFGSPEVLNRPQNANGYGLLLCFKGVYNEVMHKFITQSGEEFTRLHLNGVGWDEWKESLSNSNTIVDANGFIKTA